MPSGVVQIRGAAAPIGFDGGGERHGREIGNLAHDVVNPGAPAQVPIRLIEALERRDRVSAGENEIVDARGAPFRLALARPAGEREALRARGLDRIGEGFRLRRVGLVVAAQADERRAARLHRVRPPLRRVALSPS